MRLIDADKLKQHYAWWNDENKELFDAIVDIQPTVEPKEAKRGKWLMCMKTGRLECTACGHQTGEILGRQVTDFPEEELKNAEICILATKGHPKRVDAGVRQVILSHIEEHSKKPDEARERIVRLMGDLPRVELFARQSPEGWDVWGNEVECTAHLPMEETPCCG